MKPHVCSFYFIPIKIEAGNLETARETHENLMQIGKFCESTKTKIRLIDFEFVNVVRRLATIAPTTLCTYVQS